MRLLRALSLALALTFMVAFLSPSMSAQNTAPQSDDSFDTLSCHPYCQPGRWT
jgi:hypothetical protein